MSFASFSPARWRALASVVIVAATLSGCLGESADNAPPLGPPDVVLDVFAGLADAEYRISPDPVSVPLGSIVELRVTNAGIAPHTYTIHELDADTGILEGGENATLTFRADRAGSFEIRCDVPGHYEDGMKATLVVT